MFYQRTDARSHGVTVFFFYPDVLYNQENEKELLVTMDIDHPVRESTGRYNNTVIESEVSEELSDENTEPSRKI